MCNVPSNMQCRLYGPIDMQCSWGLPHMANTPSDPACATYTVAFLSHCCPFCVYKYAGGSHQAICGRLSLITMPLSPLITMPPYPLNMMPPYPLNMMPHYPLNLCARSHRCDMPLPYPDCDQMRVFLFDLGEGTLQMPGLTWVFLFDLGEGKSSLSWPP